MRQLADTKEIMWKEWPQWLNSCAFLLAWSLDILFLFQSLESKKFLFPYESELESESHSVMSDSLQPRGLYTVLGILQARKLEWLVYLFSSRSSQPRNWTRVCCLAGGFFTSWYLELSGKPYKKSQLNSYL